MVTHRYEMGADDGNLDMAAARKIIAEWGGFNIREAYRDMGTWRGTNQPRVLAFSVDHKLAEMWGVHDMCEKYRRVTGKRSIFIETRRVR